MRYTCSEVEEDSIFCNQLARKDEKRTYLEFLLINILSARMARKLLIHGDHNSPGYVYIVSYIHKYHKYNKE